MIPMAAAATTTPALISSVAQILWPLAVLVGLFVFARPLAGLIRSGSDREDVTIELGGQRVTFGKFREQQNEATLDLRRQLDELQRQVKGAPEPEVRPDAPRSVLWVDDQPENNALFIDQLQTDGVTVDLARATSEGMERLGRRTYGAVVTDMGRAEGGEHRPDAGLDLVRRVRATGDTTPVLVFTSPRAVRVRGQDAREAGAQDITSSGTGLLAFLRSAGVVD